MSKGTNTAWILNGPNGDRLTLASRNQLSDRIIKEENNFGNDTEETDASTLDFSSNDQSSSEDNETSDTLKLRRSDRRVQKPIRFGFDE